MAQIIYLAKKAQLQLKNGKTASAKRLIKKITRFEEKELAAIKEESGSEALFRQCGIIYYQAKKLLNDFYNFDTNQALDLLDQIIALEQVQVTEMVKANASMPKEILKQIDPYIRKLVHEINRLSFVKKTLFSCSSHFPTLEHGASLAAYLIIEYSWDSPTESNILPFHNALAKVAGAVSFKRTLIKPFTNPLELTGNESRIDLQDSVGYYILRRRELEEELNQMNFATFEDIISVIRPIKKQVIKRWNLMSGIVKKYQDIQSLTYQQRKRSIKKRDLLLHVQSRESD